MEHLGGLCEIGCSHAEWLETSQVGDKIENLFSAYPVINCPGCLTTIHAVKSHVVTLLQSVNVDIDFHPTNAINQSNVPTGKLHTITSLDQHPHRQQLHTNDTFTDSNSLGKYTNKAEEFPLKKDRWHVRFENSKQEDNVMLAGNRISRFNITLLSCLRT